MIYATRTGNTKLVAEAITDVLRRCCDVEVRDAAQTLLDVPDVDLIVIGGPTERHALTAPIAGLLEHPWALRRTMFATFDTRLRWPRLLSGSAAHDIAGRLTAMGATLLLPPESFFVKGLRDTYELESGELERARTWAAELAEAIDASVPVEA